MSDSSPLLRPALEGLAGAGLNLHGVLAAADFDPLVPPAWRCGAQLATARSVVVVGAGGPAFFARFRASPEAALDEHPLDAYTRRAVGEAAARLEAAGARARALFYFERHGGAFADFVALGRASGLGAPSRLGLLLHPAFGPWLSLRAAILSELALEPTPPLADFAPCDGCAAPCVRACRGHAYDGGAFDVAACARSVRADPACQVRCDARRACVVGPEHAYAPEAQAYHAGQGVKLLRLLDTR